MKDTIHSRHIIPDNAIPTYGITSDEISKLHSHQRYYTLPIICLDVANGHHNAFVEQVKSLRNTYPDITIIAGNVCTTYLTELLINAGADVVKIGIGPGAQCTTRLVTGVGFPQFSAVIECADAAHHKGAHVIADGGIVNIGDIAKAFGAGADFVMLGTVLAGHEESETPMEQMRDGSGRLGVKFYGSSSNSANSKRNNYSTSEGRTSLIPCKGPVTNTVEKILGGLRSSCSYVGAHSIEELQEKATFVKVYNQYNDSYVQYTIGD